MVITSNPLVTTIETLRDRVRHLEAETMALRSDLDLMLVWANWEAKKTVSPEAIRAVVVPQAEVEDYGRFLSGQFSEDVLRLTLQAHKVASFLKQRVRREEEGAAITAVVEAAVQIAAESGFELPIEMEAVIGD
ncbi:MAG: hypothetical protein KIT87_22475 [Anaerolineae bacterium]|nr:hypothetical protein [Anaerolineae bacterium]